MSAPISNRPCQANNPATCNWHRNGVMAGLHSQAADAALARGDMDAALSHADEAKAYRLRQDAVDAGDYASVAEFTRKDIEQDRANLNSEYGPRLNKDFSAKKTAKPHGPSGFHRHTLTLSSREWVEMQTLAAKHNVQLQFDGVVDVAGRAEVQNLVVTGARNDVMYVHAHVGPILAASEKAEREAFIAQRTAANKAFSNAKRLVRSASLSEEHWRRVRGAADELGVKLKGGHYAQQADGSIELTNVVLEGGDTEVAAINNVIEDTPTEHVARIPSFEDFKRAFGFKKAS